LALINGAQGMFRWVALQLIELKKCRNPRAITNQLENLPKGLYETYDQILSKINANDSTDTKTFLRWLSFSAYPLSLEELSEAVVVEGFESEDGPQFDSKLRYFNKRKVLENYSGLITESEGKRGCIGIFSLDQRTLSLPDSSDLLGLPSAV